MYTTQNITIKNVIWNLFNCPLNRNRSVPNVLISSSLTISFQMLNAFCFRSFSFLFLPFVICILFIEISRRKRKRCSSEKRKSYVPSIKKTIHSISISHVAKSPKYQLQHHHHLHRRQLLINRYAQRSVKKPLNWKNTAACQNHQHRQTTQATNCTSMNQYHQYQIKVCINQNVVYSCQAFTFRFARIIHQESGFFWIWIWICSIFVCFVYSLFLKKKKKSFLNQ